MHAMAGLCYGRVAAFRQQPQLHVRGYAAVDDTYSQDVAILVLLCVLPTLLLLSLLFLLPLWLMLLFTAALQAP
jgi:hypothetical protein